MSGVSRVIVGASGSPGSLRALRYAEELARHTDAMLIPVLAWVPPGGDFAERCSPCQPLREVWQDAAHERLAETIGSAWGAMPAGLTVRPLVERGDPGRVLVDIACFPEDVLVVGAGRRGRLGRFHGGVSHYCLRHAQCPVLAVPPAALPGSECHGLRRWAFRHRELTLGRALREWGRTPA